MDNIVEFPSRRRGTYLGTRVTFRPMVLKLKAYYDFYWMDSGMYRRVQFIKVTRKGFNLLDPETGRCMLSNHMYMPGMKGRDIPSHWTEVRVWVPCHIGLESVKAS